MASSMLVLALVSLALLLFTCQADLIGDVCSKSTNPSLCNRLLRSDPRSAGADLRGLGQVTVDWAEAATRAAIRLAKSVEGGKDKAIAETCIEAFNSAIDNLNEWPDLLKARDRFSISTLQTRASAALTYATNCDNEFGEREPPTQKMASKIVQDLVDVLLIIANRM